MLVRVDRSVEHLRGRARADDAGWPGPAAAEAPQHRHDQVSRLRGRCAPRRRRPDRRRRAREVGAQRLRRALSAPLRRGDVGAGSPAKRLAIRRASHATERRNLVGEALRVPVERRPHRDATPASAVSRCALPERRGAAAPLENVGQRDAPSPRARCAAPRRASPAGAARGARELRGVGGACRRPRRHRCRRVATSRSTTSSGRAASASATRVAKAATSSPVSPLPAAHPRWSPCAAGAGHLRRRRSREIDDPLGHPAVGGELAAGDRDEPPCRITISSLREIRRASCPSSMQQRPDAGPGADDVLGAERRIDVERAVAASDR